MRFGVDKKCVALWGLLLILVSVIHADVSTGGHSWNQITFNTTAPSPSLREFSSSRIVGNVLYLFAGRTFNKATSTYTYNNDLWGYDLVQQSWTSLASAPSGRAGHAMVATSTSLIVFGGYSGSTYLNDVITYSISNNAWSTSSPANVTSAPNPVAGASATIVNSFVWIFGGSQCLSQTCTNTPNAGVYQYNPSSNGWSVLNSDSTPSPRWGATVVTQGSSMLMYGGFLTSSTFDPIVWSFDGTAWSNFSPTTTPPSRGYHTAVSTSNGMLIFGGQQSSTNYFNDVWLYSPKWNSWTNIQTDNTQAPDARAAQTSSTTSGEIFVFGGVNSGGQLNDLWKLNVGVISWTSLSSLPLQRSRHASVSSVDGSTVYVFGGMTSSSPVTNDLLAYNVASNSWITLSTSSGPSARTQASIAIVSGALLIFGGQDSTGTDLLDVWKYALPSGPWQNMAPAPGPSARSEHSAVSVSTRMIIFGGESAGVVNSDLWAYDLNLNGWIHLATPPIGLVSHTATLVNSSLMYVFGGSTATSQASNFLYLYTVSSNIWSKVALTGNSVPPMRTGHAMTTVTNGFVVLGGVDANGNLLNDLWRFDVTSNSWTNLDEFSSQSAPGQYLTASTTTSGVVVVGGEISGTPSSSVLLLNLGTTVYVSPTGSDKNTGTQSAPFLTLRQAVSSVLYGSVVINTGTYTGYGNLFINAQTAVSISSSGSVTINCAGLANAFNIAENSVPIYLSSFTIQACSQNAIIVQNAQANFNQVTFQSNTQSALLISAESSVSITGSTFTQNTGTYGSAIYSTDSSLIISGSTFSHNQASNFGGCLWADSAVSISSTTFDSNSAVIGGAVYLTATTANLNTVTFTNNQATIGGALYSTSSSLTSSTSAFSNNAATKNGGAVQIVSGSATFTAGTFSSNSANMGGAIAGDLGSINTSGTSISQNTAINGGGAIYVDGSNLSVNQGTIANNNGGLVGGAIFADNQAVVSTFQANINSNQAVNGGGIYVDGLSNATIGAGTMVQMNTVTQNGGGAYFANTVGSVISGAMFLFNNANNGGGGGYFFENVAPSTVGVSYNGNSADYGLDSATISKKLGIFTGSSTSQVGGVAFSVPIVVGVYDSFGQLVSSQNSAVFSVSTSTPTFSVSGTITAQTVSGKGSFGGIIVSPPSSNTPTPVTLVFQGVNIPVTSVSYTVTITGCQLGYVPKNGLCVPCGLGTYRDSSVTVCTYCQPGYYSDYVGLTSCKPCQPGSNTTLPGQTQCSPCPGGTAAQNQATQLCTPCAMGSSSGEGATQCDQCDPGSYAFQEGMAACELCPVGQFQPNFGASSCSDCPTNRKASTIGSTTCLTCQTCTAGTWAQSVDPSQCPVCTPCSPGYFSGSGATYCSLCPPGTFSFKQGASGCTLCSPGTFASSPGALTCSPCDVKTIATEFGSSTCSQCPIQSYSVNGTSCKTCPVGAVCVGDVPLAAAPNYYGSEKTGYYPCLHVNACKGNNQCNEPFDGPLCSVCDKGYGRVGTNCIKCKDSYVGAAWFVGIVIALCLAALTVFAFYYHRQAQATGNPINPRATSINIFFTHLQVLGFIAVFKVRWSNPISLWYFIITAVSVMNFSNYAYDCHTDMVVYGQFGFFMLFPILCLLISLIVLGIIHLVRSRIQKQGSLPEGSWNYWITFNLFVLRFFHPIITLQVFEMFDCVNVDGTEYLVAETSIMCNTSSHKAAKGIGLIVWLTYCVFLPIYILRKLFQNRKDLRGDPLTAAFSFLYDGVKTSRFWWQFMEIIRIGILIFFVILLRRYTALEQLYSITWLFICTLFIFFFAKPYPSRIHMLSEFFAILAQFGSMITGAIYFDQSSQRRPFYRNVDGLFIFLNTLVVIALIVLIIFVSKAEVLLQTFLTKYFGGEEVKEEKPKPKEPDGVIDPSQVMISLSNRNAEKRGRIIEDSDSDRGSQKSVTISESSSESDRTRSSRTRSRTSSHHSRGSRGSRHSRRSRSRTRSRSPTRSDSSRSPRLGTPRHHEEDRTRSRSVSVSDSDTDSYLGRRNREREAVPAANKPKSKSKSRSPSTSRTRSRSVSRSISRGSDSDDSYLARKNREKAAATQEAPAPVVEKEKEKEPEKQPTPPKSPEKTPPSSRSSSPTLSRSESVHSDSDDESDSEYELKRGPGQRAPFDKPPAPPPEGTSAEDLKGKGADIFPNENIGKLQQNMEGLE